MKFFQRRSCFFCVDLSIFASDKAGVDFGDLRQKWAYYIRNIGNLRESDVKRETGIFREFVNECRMSNLNNTPVKIRHHYFMYFFSINPPLTYYPKSPCTIIGGYRFP